MIHSTWPNLCVCSIRGTDGRYICLSRTYERETCPQLIPNIFDINASSVEIIAK